MLEIITPAATHDLTVLATAKRELGITDTSQDVRIADLIEEASGMISAWCNRDGFGREVVRQTERLTDPRASIVLARDIGVSITSVVEDGVTIASTDYEVAGSLLYRLRDDARSTWKAGKVVIEYAAGIVLPTDVPRGLERACLDLIQRLHPLVGRDTTVKSESVEGVGSISYVNGSGSADVGTLPPDRLAVLERLKRIYV